MLIFSPHSHSSNHEKKIRFFAAKGFTLLELLAVVAILGILATIVLTNLNGARVKSRDARRLTDLDTFQSVVEEYYRDNGHYPIVNCSNGDTQPYAAFPGSTPSFAANTVCNTLNGVGVSLSTALSPYLPTPLLDPKGPVGSPGQQPAGGYLYASSDGRSYCILFNRMPENMNDFPLKDIDMVRCQAIDSNGQCHPTASGNSNNNIYYSSVASSDC